MSAPRNVATVLPEHEKRVPDGCRQHHPRASPGPVARRPSSHDRHPRPHEEKAVGNVRQPNNRGYGAALKAGIRAATTECVLTMIADGQHRMQGVTNLCKALTVDAPPDCVIGHRTKLALASRGYRTEFLSIQVERRVGKSSVSVTTGFQTILLGLICDQVAQLRLERFE